MSRMIDADALKDNMFGYAPPEMTWDRGDIEHKIDEMPTIDAIPVEWIRSLMLDGWPDDSKAAWRVLKAWKEEQEART